MGRNLIKNNKTPLDKPTGAYAIRDEGINDEIKEGVKTSYYTIK